MTAETRLLAALADAPAVARGWVLASPCPTPGPATLLVEWAQRDCATNRQRRYLTSHGLGRGDPSALPPPPPPPAPVAADVALSSPSPSGARQLIIRAPPPAAPTRANAPDAGAHTLELWSAGRCALTLDIPPSVHGAVHGDGVWFGAGGASWSAGEGRIAYVAEAPKSVDPPAHGRELVPAGVVAASLTTPTALPREWKGVGPAEGDWGECLAGCLRPTVFVLDVSAAALMRIHAPVSHDADDDSIRPDDDDSVHACGHPSLSPDGRAVVFAAWPPRDPALARLGASRLGVTYCTNRACALWAVRLPDEAAGGVAADAPCAPGAPLALTAGLLRSALSPRFNPAGTRLAFLSHEAAATSGAHNGTAALWTLAWDPRAAGPAAGEGPREIVAVVDAPTSRSAFPGLYAASLPDRPWLDNRSLAVTTQWGPTSEVALVDADAGRVARAGDRGAFPGAWTFLGAGAGWLAAVVSSPCAPPEVVVCDVVHHVAHAAGGGAPAARWRRAARADGAPPLLREPALTALAGVTTVVLDLPHGVHCIAVLPPGVAVASTRGACATTSPPPPCVLVPHGGPHAAHADAWVLSTAFLAGLGYTVLLTNFRGSTGQGEACVRALPGAIGEMDVADCVSALDAAVQAGVADPARVAVVGGSHGGFLAGHLVGQHPTRFRAGVLRNPVLDLSLMVGVTDIPDWCWVEACGAGAAAARGGAAPSLADLERFRDVSPIAHVDEVTAPLLFLLGGKDRRVPPADATRYVSALRARRGAPEARVLLFGGDSHALDQPQTEFEAWAAVAAWLKAHVLGEA